MDNCEIYRNSVLHSLNDGYDYRVLWVNRKSTSYWINITRQSNTPDIFNYEVVEQGLLDGTYTLGVDTWCPVIDKVSLSEKEKQKQKRAWGLIKSVVGQEPDVYVPSMRSQLLKGVEKQTGVNHKNLYIYLGRYWRGGLTPDALYPNLKTIGKTRDIYKESSARSGRKKKEGCVGKKLGLQDTNIFAKAVNEFYLTCGRKSLPEAYRNMLGKYYAPKDETGKVVPMDPDDIPSFYQFRYWYYKNRDIVDATRKKEGEGKFELEHRALLEKVETYLFGPGDKVQVDATIADIYLVRRSKRDAIVGRPTLYMVVDSVTHMAVGLHVTFDAPSMQGARMAIMNCASNKVDFCRRYGIDISEASWPCRFLPKVVVADRGELEGKQADVLTENLGITVENAPPYRGDLKPLVEQYFHLINVKLSDDIPGRIQPDVGERGAHDYRLDSILDIYQFTEIIIRIILFYNNAHWMKGYERSMLVRQYSIPSVPRDLWNFEINHRGGALTTIKKENIIAAIFPKEEATITESGIRFRGMNYTCEQAIREKWFEKARITGVDKITVSYNPSDAAFIYLTRDNTVLECHLVEHHGMYCGLHLKEVSDIKEDDKTLAGVHEIDELNEDVFMKNEIQKIIEMAKKQAEDTSEMSKAERLRGMNENNQAERQDNIDENTTKSLEESGLIPISQSESKDCGPVGKSEPEPGSEAQPGKQDTVLTPLEKILLELQEEEEEEEE